MFALQSDKRFTLLTLGTGVGKSLVGVMLQLMLDARAVYATHTRGLQDQLISPEKGFPDHFIDVRGMQNYECLEEGIMPAQGGCSAASCVDGVFCKKRLGGCLYFDQVARAAARPLVSTNYAWWLHGATKEEEPLGPRDLLICDEAHGLADALGDHMRLYITERECDGAWRLGPGWRRWDHGDWRTWAAYAWPRIEEARTQAVTQGKRRTLRALAERVSKLERQLDESWLLEVRDEKATFEPLWPHGGAEGLCFRGIPKVVLMTATGTPAMLPYLGVPDGEWDAFDGGSPLPPARRPIYALPFHRLSLGSSPAVWMEWVELLDQIVDARLDRRGIIHTLSEDRARFYVAHSRHAKRCIVHENGQAAAAVYKFKDSPAGSVLVSQSVGEGWDFPFDAARYQVIGKLPWVPPSPIVQARAVQDPLYEKQLMVADIVQMCGRVMRDPKDWGETIIADGHMDWIRKKYRALFPSYWHAAYRLLGSIGGKIQLPRPPALDF
jgi:Rad3-related DNA helicase